jgi:hypothetical protein
VFLGDGVSLLDEGWRLVTSDMSWLGGRYDCRSGPDMLEKMVC